MRHSSFINQKKALFLFEIYLLLIAVTICCAQTRSLRPHENIVFANASGNIQTFAIDVNKNQVISLEIKQNGIDVTVELLNPQGAAAAYSDYPFSEQDVERIFVVAETKGKYVLKVKPKFTDEQGTANLKLDDIREAAPDDFKHADAEKLFSQAQVLRATGKTTDRQKALEIYGQSRLIWQQLGDKIGELRALSILSYLNRILGRNEKSSEFAEQILRFPDFKEYLPYKSDALYQLGQIQNGSGKTDEAIKSLRASLALLVEPSPKQENILATLSFVYYSNEYIELAEQNFEAALDNIRQFPDIYNEAQLRHILGLFYQNLGDYDSAVDNLKRVIELRKKFGNRRGAAISLAQLGETYYFAKNLPESFKALEEAVSISQELGDTENHAETLARLAVNYRETGNAPKALELLKKGLTLLQNTNSASLNILYITLGVTLTELGNFPEARAFFEKAVRGFRQTGDINGEARSLYQFAKLERAENNLEAAKDKIERALQLHEYEQAKYKNIRRLSNFLENRNRYFGLNIDVLMSLEQKHPGAGFAFRALQISENVRMRTLIWELREALKFAPQSADFQIINQFQKVQQQIGEQLSLLAKAQSNPNQSKNISGIEAQIANFNRQSEQLKAQLRLNNPNFANLAQPPTLSLGEMQAELDDETVLIEYSLGEFRSFLWIVSKNDFQSFTLPKRAEIDAQAQNFYQTLTAASEKSFVREDKNRTGNPKVQIEKRADSGAAGENLSRTILTEKLAQIPAKRLIVVANGSLNLIPFASLTFPGANSQKPVFIAERFETIRLPSLTTLSVLRQRQSNQFNPKSLAVIADPVFSNNDERLRQSRKAKISNASVETDLTATLRDFNLTRLARLPFTRFEAERIAQNFPQKTSLNLNFRASRDRILNGDFDRFDILHFATHGFLNDKHPELSGLVLSLVDEKGGEQNGFLRTQDLYLLKIKPQLVVLSACQTGLGKQSENDGLLGLTRGFLANGTPRVISTLWKVDDAATAELMSRFYRVLLKENKKPSEALRTAQNELRQIPRFSNPRYWAGFVLTGEWQ